MPKPRRSVVESGVFQEAVGTNYRFWAAVPELRVVTFIGAYGAVLARVPRPGFPPGVCTGCGCREDDPCPGEVGEGCFWVDRAQTRCSRCGLRRAKR